MEGGEFSSSPNRIPINQRKKKNKNTRRFNDDQIRSLESMFKLETKLEPKKKLQLARELELQPRQVAIWFQNRRARWKSKQLEQEYRLLKSNYDNLNSRFESLKEENQTLLTQFQKLSDLLKETHDVGMVSKGLEGSSTHRGLDDEDTNSEVKTNPSTSMDRQGHGSIMHSDDDERGDAGYLAQYEEPELLNLCEHLHGSLAPAQKWCNFDSGGIPEHASGNTNWWDFWT